MEFHVDEERERQVINVDVPLDIRKFCMWLNFFMDEEDITKIVKAISCVYAWEEELSNDRICYFNYEDIIIKR